MIYIEIMQSMKTVAQ